MKKNLSFLATKSGKFTIAAFDHRESLKKMLNPDDPEAVPREEIVALKRLLVQIIGSEASAVLLDPVYGLGVVTEKPEQAGLLWSLEKSGYGGRSEGRVTELVQEWGVKEVKEYGGAAKLALYFHPESNLAGRQVALVQQVAEECRRYQVVFLLEPLVYRLEGMGEEDLERGRLKWMIKTIETFRDEGVDIFKLEFPIDPAKNSDKQDWEQACLQLAATVKQPWVLLSQGMEFEWYRQALRVACQAGASGFAVGRAVWQEIGDRKVQGGGRITDRLQRIKLFLETTALGRMRELVGIVEEWGKDWRTSFS